VGETSYAAVPHLVRIHQQRGTLDGNTYAFVSTVELARGRGANPPVPEWLQPGYNDAFSALGQMGLRELPGAKNREDVQYILAFLALWKGARRYGSLLNDFAEEEFSELVEKGMASF
jgi:hypothetical protein